MLSLYHWRRITAIKRTDFCILISRARITTHEKKVMPYSVLQTIFHKVLMEIRTVISAGAFRRGVGGGEAMSPFRTMSLISVTAHEILQFFYIKCRNTDSEEAPFTFHKYFLVNVRISMTMKGRVCML